MVNSDAMFRVDGNVAIVTGAGRGIGRAIARGLASAGADVACVARTASEVESLAAELRSMGSSSSYFTCDVTSVESVRRMVSDVLGHHGRVDVLINNAGAKVAQASTDVDESAWDLVVDTNLKGAFFAAQAVAPHMLERGSGRIVNVASTYAIVGAQGRASYAASKGGLLQLTRTLAVEWAGRGVNVNAIGPTSTATPMNSALFSDPDWRRVAISKIPAGRFCEPEDVIGAVVFLVSPASAMVNGHLLLIDGGFTAA